MASIENRSRTQVTVKNHPGLTRLFPFDNTDDVTRYKDGLKAKGYKPTLAVLDESYLIRFWVNGKRKNFTASSEAEAIATKQRIESDQHRGLFVVAWERFELSLCPSWARA